MVRFVPTALVVLALALGLPGRGAAQTWDMAEVRTHLATTASGLSGLSAHLERSFECFIRPTVSGCASVSGTNHTNSSGSSGPAGASGTAAAWFAGSGKFDFGGQQNGKVLDTCGNELPAAWSPVCNRRIAGDTKGCECKGTKMVNAVVMKAVNSEYDDKAVRNMGNLAAFAADKSMQDKFKMTAAMQDNENKWLYFGAVDGSYALYPGRMWPRDSDGGCGRKYDPRVRPWYLSASNGPKNVIFILDTSGSMGQYGRMQLLKKAAKQVIDSLTFADYIGLVDFDSEARTMKSLNFLAPAAAGFRDEAKIFIDQLQDSGGTPLLWLPMLERETERARARETERERGRERRRSSLMIAREREVREDETEQESAR